MSGSPLQGEGCAAPGDSVAIHLVADADPDALARIANVILLANALPWCVLLYTEGAEVRVEIELRGVEDSIVERIRRKLTQLTCVTEVGMQAGGVPFIRR